MFDSHCHLDDAKFDDDRPATLQRAFVAGVTDILVPAIRPATFDKLIGIMSSPTPVRLHLALGFHPQVVPSLSEHELLSMKSLPQRLSESGAVAVGECGLDGPTGHMDLQEQIFRDQIRIARALSLPLVVHAFRTHEAVLAILKNEQANKVGGVIHSYSGGASLVSRYVDLGFALSFGGSVTWPRALKPIAAAACVPHQWLMAETDAPDQSPQSLRGKRNEPASVGEVIASLAMIQQQPLQHLQRLTTDNARRIFRL
jgi:TatD DNase family protein